MDHRAGEDVIPTQTPALLPAGGAGGKASGGGSSGESRRGNDASAELPLPEEDEEEEEDEVRNMIALGYKLQLPSPLPCERAQPRRCIAW